MPPPTTYTEASLTQYMETVLGNVAVELSWTASDGHLDEALNDVLLAYSTPVVAIALATDIRKLRALARVEAWRAAVQTLAAEYDYETETQAFTRSQLHKQALAALTQAERDADAYLPAYAVDVLPIRFRHDPYAYLPTEVRVLP